MQGVHVVHVARIIWKLRVSSSKSESMKHTQKRTLPPLMSLRDTAVDNYLLVRAITASCVIQRLVIFNTSEICFSQNGVDRLISCTHHLLMSSHVVWCQLFDLEWLYQEMKVKSDESDTWSESRYRAILFSYTEISGKKQLLIQWIQICSKSHCAV